MTSIVAPLRRKRLSINGEFFTVYVPASNADTVSEIMADYWALRGVDDYGHILWINSLPDIYDRHSMTADVIRILLTSAPQARIAGHQCDLCHEDFRWSNRTGSERTLGTLAHEGHATCQSCRKDARAAFVSARKSEKIRNGQAEAKVDPWTCSVMTVAAVRSGRLSSVKDVATHARSICRGCGKKIQAGETRLKFPVENAFGFVTVFIHQEPCTKRVTASGGVPS
jgi:hypothetical protein